MKRIYINRNHINHNKEHADKLPPIKIEDGKETVECFELDIIDNGRVVASLVYDSHVVQNDQPSLVLKTECDVKPKWL